MKKNLLVPVFLVCLCWLLDCPAGAQTPVFNAVNAVTSSVTQFQKFELDIRLTARYNNPYDYNDIAVRAVFTSPRGRKDTVDGFYMQDYNMSMQDGNLTASGSGFKVRFTPIEPGTWHYQLTCTSTNGSALQAPQTFTCTPAAAKGFIRRNNTNYLGFDDGTQYIPVGENLAWPHNGVVASYNSWINKLADNKANFIRIWLAHWGLGIEWKNGTNGFGGLKQYKQTSSFYLDWLLDLCQQKGVYMMFCINHHGQVSSKVDPNWTDNPYNAANGGPCANTWDFFTNPLAKDAHKNRLRYIIARWGYSPNIMSWELFNEVEWTDDFINHQDEITKWHAEMASFLKANDVNKHLVTTSYAHENADADTWSLPGIDFTQTHYYVGLPNLESVLSAGSVNYLSTFNKPTLNGEFGIEAGKVDLGTIDPNGVYIHNGMWGALLGGGMGSAMSWWWDSYIDPRNLYRYFGPLTQFISGINLKAGNYRRTFGTTTGGSYSEVVISPGTEFGTASTGSFNLDAEGGIKPAARQAAKVLYGNVYNTQYRNPPAFTVNYPVDGAFKIVTANVTGTSPRLNVFVDGTEVLNQNATVNTTYTVSIPAGNHVIKIDNLGTDWISVSKYIFTNISSSVSNYILRSGDSSGVAGWILNKQYNWKYIQEHNGAIPVAVSGGAINIPGVKNGTYRVRFYDCLTGAVSGTTTAIATNNTLSVTLPILNWDLAFTANLQD